MCEQLQSALEAIDRGVWGAFQLHVQSELGDFGELRGFSEQDLRDIFAEFCRVRRLEPSALQRARCVKALCAYAAHPAEGAAPAPAAAAPPQAAGTLRRRQAADVNGRGATEWQQAGRAAAADETGQTAAPKPRPRRPQSEAEILQGMSRRRQIVFVLCRGLATFVLFVFMHTLLRKYVLTPMFHEAPEQLSVEELLKKAEDGGTFKVRMGAD
eukprot:TRINITY_DN23334_c0_g1_i1.p1 TRINITY_DN23334_c0_g1~~TRINITY_DN23334_c0_g1_i1.p1  ORF type:complete len:239 (+),score=77.11 TRINITY_DN23334_c0_g1_i1:81-719(+)